MKRAPALVLIAVTTFALACEKTGSESSVAPTATADAEPADRLDAACDLLLAKLAEGDYEGLREHSVAALHHDLSQPEFEDLAKIVQWLGPLQERRELETDPRYGGGQRWYDLRFSQGSNLSLEISIDEDGELSGFRFEGSGYTDAEHAVIAEQWREFKVYDFHYLDGPDGQPLEKGAPIAGRRVDYEIVLGGIEAVLGEHHLEVEKIVRDAKGQEVYHQPIEYDVKFAADATGIPRGVIRGYLEVPGPGKWKMDLVIKDVHANRDLDYREQFTTR